MTALLGGPAHGTQVPDDGRNEWLIPAPAPRTIHYRAYEPVMVASYGRTPEAAAWNRFLDREPRTYMAPIEPMSYDVIRYQRQRFWYRFAPNEPATFDAFVLDGNTFDIEAQLKAWIGFVGMVCLGWNAHRVTAR